MVFAQASLCSHFTAARCRACSSTDISARRSSIVTNSSHILMIGSQKGNEMEHVERGKEWHPDTQRRRL